jgi:SAM-dependent methyltransferase
MASGEAAEGLEARVGARWDELSARARPARTRWWESARVRAHVNQLVCGQRCAGPSEGLLRLLSQRLVERGITTPLASAISIGGGHGYKESLLLEAGLVERFEIYELSPARVRAGRAQAEAQGLAERLRFVEGDAFSLARGRRFALVHWNNALHHMLDVDRALAWSREVLAPGGVLFLDDFVGPDRFQWSRRTLELASAVRARLPERFLRDPERPGASLARVLKRPHAGALAAADPSEAAQSSRILPSLRVHFPGRELILTGGAVYNLALKDALANFDEDVREDQAALDALLDLDALLTGLGLVESHYAVALAFVDDAASRWSERARWRAELLLRDRLRETVERARGLGLGRLLRRP